MSLPELVAVAVAVGAVGKGVPVEFPSIPGPEKIDEVADDVVAGADDEDMGVRGR